MIASVRRIVLVAVPVVIACVLIALRSKDGGSDVLLPGAGEDSLRPLAAPIARSTDRENPPAVRESFSAAEDPDATWEVSIRVVDASSNWNRGSVSLVLEHSAEGGGDTHDTDERGVWRGTLAARPQRVVAVLGRAQMFAILDSPQLDADHREITLEVEANPPFQCLVRDAIDGKSLVARASVLSARGSRDDEPFVITHDALPASFRLEADRLWVFPSEDSSRTYYVTVDGYAPESFHHLPGMTRHQVSLSPAGILEIVRRPNMDVELSRVDGRSEWIESEGPTKLRRTVPAGGWHLEGFHRDSSALERAAIDVEVPAGGEVVADLTRASLAPAKLDITLTARRGILDPEEFDVTLSYQAKLGDAQLGKIHDGFEETLEDWRCVDFGRVYTRSYTDLAPGVYTLQIGRLAVRQSIEVRAGERLAIEVEPKGVLTALVILQDWPDQEFPVRLGWKAEAAAFPGAPITIERQHRSFEVEVSRESVIFYAVGASGRSTLVSTQIEASATEARVVLPAPKPTFTVRVDFLNDRSPFVAFGDGRFEKVSGPGLLIKQSTHNKRSWAWNLEFSASGHYELRWQEGPQTCFRFEIEVDESRAPRWVDIHPSPNR